MADDFGQGNAMPKAIGGFNFAKSVIENKVDVLTFLEILVRKKIVTLEELDEIRAAVVAHMNHAYPELELTYTTPASLADQAPLPAALVQPTGLADPNGAETQAPAAQAKQDVPLYYQAPPPKFFNG